MNCTKTANSNHITKGKQSPADVQLRGARS